MCYMWGRRASHTGCSWGNLRARDLLEGLVVYVRMVFQLIIKKLFWEVMDWIDLAEHKCSWRALVNAVKNRFVSRNAGSFSTGWDTRHFETESVS